jgi:hypothetical protein
VEVEKGQTAEVVLTLKRAIRVSGVVREKGTETPIAGVQVAVTLAETGAMTTGPDGSYEGYVPPEVTYLFARYIPPGYARPLYGLPQVRIPNDAAEFELPPFELLKAGELPGLVVDDRARRVAGAEIEAEWTLDETRPGTGLHHLSARTGPDGRFVFQGVPLDAEVLLSAHHNGLQTLDPEPARAGEATILRLTSSKCVAMQGQVVDSAGRPIARANVHLRSREPQAAARGGNENELVVFEGGFVLVTDANGQFQTPKELDPDRDYIAYAQADGYQFYRTQWTSASIRSFTGLTLPADAESR